MKKYLLISSILALCAVLLSCSSNETDALNEEISKLLEDGLPSSRDVQDLEGRYNNLTDKQKKKIENHETLENLLSVDLDTIHEINNSIDAINLLGEDTVVPKEKLLSLQQKYNSLKGEDKGRINGYDIIDSRIKKNDEKEKSGKYDIEVGPISIIVNGEELHATNAKGKELPVFLYKSSTYVPLRALSDAFELNVEYDPDNKIVKVSKPNPEKELTTTAPVGQPTIAQTTPKSIVPSKMSESDLDQINRGIDDSFNIYLEQASVYTKYSDAFNASAGSESIEEFASLCKKMTSEIIQIDQRILTILKNGSSICDKYDNTLIKSLGQEYDSVAKTVQEEINHLSSIAQSNINTPDDLKKVMKMMETYYPIGEGLRDLMIYFESNKLSI